MSLQTLKHCGAVIGLLIVSNAASAYTIDGQFSDWGVDHTTLVSSTAREQGQEDQHANYLNPGFGGQRYDAEAMYLDWDDEYFYVGILTGLPSNNAHSPNSNSYGPGDILFDFGKDNDPEFALKTRNAGGLVRGKLYAPGTWQYGIWSAPGVLANAQSPATDIVGISTGHFVSDTSFAYNNNHSTGLGQWSSDKHYFIEARIPLSAFGLHWNSNGPSEALNVQWAALCANDIIVVDPAPVSEPQGLALLGLTLSTLVPAARRTRKNKK